MRYGVVGIANNLLGYLIYLVITGIGVRPGWAVTILYPIGALIGYFSHARYSFAYEGHPVRGIIRYATAHCVGYGANLLVIYMVHDVAHLPHQLAQAIAIFAVAGLLFLLFHYFVFPTRPIGNLFE